MAKTLIEIDEEYLAAAQRVLGTATKKNTSTRPCARLQHWQPGAGTCKDSPPMVFPTLTMRT